MNPVVLSARFLACTLITVSSGCGLVLDLERPTDGGAPGMDASTADAGGAASDAGTDDAGTDDAGTDDAGTDDAGMGDAGSEDAGSEDAGSEDAGTEDAGDPFCGDAVLNGTEQCDDGNRDAGDGCENDCTFSCVLPADCDDSDPCSVDACTEHVCSHEVTVCPATSCGRFIGCDSDGACLYDRSAADADGDSHDSVDCGGDDCDDGDPDVNPDGVEVCDGHDQDCDGNSDEGLPRTTCFEDLDGDGYGDGRMTIDVCGSTCPADYADSPGDCWDTAATTTPPASAAHPMQSRFFAMSRSDGTDSFDWNCDGRVERESTSPVNCGSDCMGTAGWFGDIPGCGERGMWATCAGVTPSGCALASERRAQRCR